MNYQGKNRLFTSIGLAILLIITFVLLVISKQEAGGVLILFSSIIIIMAFLGIYFTYQQVKRIQKRLTNISDNYKSVYMNAHELIGTYQMNKSDKKEILNMILEIFEHASFDGRDVDEVVGGDLSSFVDSFVSETGKTHTGKYLISYSTSLFVGYLLLMKLYKVVRSGNISMETIKFETLDVGLVVTYGLIAYIFFPCLLLVIQKSSRQQWQGYKRILTLFPFIIPLGLMACLISISNPIFIQIIDTPIPIFTNLWSIGIGIIILITSLISIKLTSQNGCK